ncbi:MAG: cytochrome c3 family protein [Calditrichia bacterium]
MTYNRYIKYAIYLGILTIFLLFLPDLVMAQNMSQLADENQCINCHMEEEILPDDFNKNDIHLQSGLSCSGCHGGDPTKDDMDDAMDPEAGYTGVPSKKDIPQFCGRCHSDINIMREYQPRIPVDQVYQYYTSIHGQKLKQGDNNVADCTNCHTGHGILSAKDPRSTVYPLNIPATCNKCHGDADYMKNYKIPTNQFDEFAKSVHGKMLLEKHDTGSPACNDCHGNHGAMPPGITSISHVCGMCHVNNMQYFSTSIMGEVFQEQELHACEECHGHHNVQKTFDGMVGVGEESTCMNCHDEGDPGYEAAGEIRKNLERFVAIYDTAEIQRREVQQIGMNDVEINFLLQDAHQHLIEARTLVHTFDPDRVGEKTEGGVQKAKAAIQLAKQEISDYNIRRRGFGIATIFITLLVVALFFKIREIEKR